MITFKAFLNERRMSPKEFDKVAKRHADTAKVGFEFEFFIPEHSDLYFEEENKTCVGAFKNAKSELGVSDWSWTEDTSISFQSAPGWGIEIISKPEPLMEALSNCNKFFEWMQKHECKTNITTGLHINISLESMLTIDPVKLMLFLGEDYALKQFGRLANEFTAAQVTRMISQLTGTGTLPSDFKSMQVAARKALSDDKYYSVNFGKLKKGYLEFRIAGGAGYEKSFAKIKNTALRFVTALEIAADPAAERNEYIKKMSKLFDKIKANNETPNEQSLEDIISTGPSGMMVSILQSNIRKVKDGKIKTPAARKKLAAWVTDELFADVYVAFKNTGIAEPTSRQRAEFKVWLKRLGISKADLDLENPDKDVLWVVKVFSL